MSQIELFNQLLWIHIIISYSKPYSCGRVANVWVLSMSQIELFNQLLWIHIIISYSKPYSCGRVANVWVLSMSQIELFNQLLWIHIIISYSKPYSCGRVVRFGRNTWWTELLMLNINAWNNLIVYKQMINIKLERNTL